MAFNEIDGGRQGAEGFGAVDAGTAVEIEFKVVGLAEMAHRFADGRRLRHQPTDHRSQAECLGTLTPDLDNGIWARFGSGWVRVRSWLFGEWFSNVSSWAAGQSCSVRCRSCFKLHGVEIAQQRRRTDPRFAIEGRGKETSLLSPDQTVLVQL